MNSSSSPPYRQVRAAFTDHTIRVYQAYSAEIANPALAAGRFVSPFKRDRFTWIKPSFLWMMYRSGWATKPSQERVLAVEITRSGFESAEELLLLPTLLQVALTELVSVDKDEVTNVDGVLVTNIALNQIARGRPLEEQQSQFFVTPPRVEAGATEAERKAARNLSEATKSTITATDLIAMAQRQWEGRRLDEERERRLKSTRRRGSLARQRGHITAQLQNELLEELTSPQKQSPRGSSEKKG